MRRYQDYKKNLHLGWLPAFRQAIVNARSGEEKAIAFLRQMIATLAESMPEEILIAISEAVVEERQREIRGRNERN